MPSWVWLLLRNARVEALLHFKVAVGLQAFNRRSVPLLEVSLRLATHIGHCQAVDAVASLTNQKALRIQKAPCLEQRFPGYAAA